MTTSSSDTGQGAAIPLAAYQDLVAQYSHRLLSLEAELKDHAKSRELSPRAFAKRVRHLARVQKNLTTLQHLCAAETPGQATAKDIGLPVLSECTPSEVAVCEQFVSAREADVTATYGEAELVLKWLLDAVTGRAGPIRTTLRLSKLRRFIQRTERLTEQLEENVKATAGHIDRLVASRAPGSPRQASGTVAGLMTLFQQLDGTISRVAHLKALVNQEQEKTRAMDAWLRQEENKIRTATFASPPPSPLELSEAEAAAVGPHPTYRRTIRRQRVAEEFWQDVVHNGARAPTRKEISRAAALLGAAQLKSPADHEDLSDCLAEEDP